MLLGLRELGWIETRTVAIEYRWGEGRDERFAEIAAEFVRLKVDVILTYATPSSIAAKVYRRRLPPKKLISGRVCAMLSVLIRPIGNTDSGAMRRLLAEHLKEFDRVFDAEDMQILGAAFDSAWEAIQASGVRYPEDKVELVRAILAKHIIAAAKDGERDHSRLRDGALLALAQSNLRSPLR